MITMPKLDYKTIWLNADYFVFKTIQKGEKYPKGEGEIEPQAFTILAWHSSQLLRPRSMGVPIHGSDTK